MPAGDRYVPIRIGEMHKLLHDEMGFEQVDIDRCWEHVYERPVVSKSGVDYNCIIRVYTSVDVRTSVTRELAKDAIRVVIVNKDGYPVKRDGKSREARIYRTKSALTNLRKRCREIFKWAMENACPKCNHPMTERTVKKEGPNKGKVFLGCTNYPDCTYTIW